MVAIKKFSKKGFTLTELAIVLGVIGTILGGIWSGVAMMHANMKVNLMHKQLLIITNNIRGLYPGGKTFLSATHADITSSLVSAGVFPPEMINPVDNLPYTPWGTRIYAHQSTSAPDASTTQFEVYVPGPSPSKDICKLLNILNAEADIAGLTYIAEDHSWQATGTLDVTSFSCNSGSFSTDWKLKG